jgi:hypothetical protein
MPEAEAELPANYLADEIAPWEPSTPAYVVPGLTTGQSSATIYYCCILHPQERGTIVVSPG